MDFYISWSHSDAPYTDYFPECPMLISSLIDNRGVLKRINKKPKKIIIDCGSVYHAKQNKRPQLTEIFDNQMSLLEDCSQDAKITLVHFDEPMLNKNNLSERYNAMERTLFNAYEYLHIFKSKKIGGLATCMGVIQGYDQPSIIHSALELKKMGYNFFGVGSLLAKGQADQIRFIQYAAEIVGSSNLHVFGVTGIRQMNSMIKLGVASFDSSRPTMAAAFFQVFYSEPFRTYFLEESRARPTTPNRLSEPLPCDCPICENDSKDILIPSPRNYMKLRSIHNYYHLMKTIENMIKEKKEGSDAFSDVLWSRN